MADGSAVLSMIAGFGYYVARAKLVWARSNL